MTPSLADQFATILDGQTMPYDFYAQARATTPIFWSDATAGWVVTRRAETLRVLQDEEAFGPLGYGPGSSGIHGRIILHMKGIEHRKKVRVFSHRIRSPRLINDVLKPLAEDLCASYLSELPMGEPLDLKAAFTAMLPLDVTAKLMAIPEAPQFRDWYHTIVAAGASNLRGDPDVLRRGQEARVMLDDFLRPIIAERRANPGDDLLSDLCTFEYDGEPLSDTEILDSCSFVMAAGAETTDRALSSFLRFLFQNRDIWEVLRSDRSMILPALAEILRWAPPVHGVSRGARVDTELAGQPIAAGERVFVVLASANRDEDVFDRPEEFVVDRFADSANKQFTPKSDIVPFGAGRHHCTGSLLAKMEMEVAMNHLLDRISWAEWTEGAPDELGYVLRSPPHLRVRLVA